MATRTLHMEITGTSTQMIGSRTRRLRTRLAYKLAPWLRHGYPLTYTTISGNGTTGAPPDWPRPQNIC